MSEILTFPIRSDKLVIQVKSSAHLLHKRTEFQTIDIFDTEAFGRVLLLDGHIQLTDFDEHAYHEALVQIPLMALQSPKSALVIGGGDGGVLRELCGSQTLESIEMVEIDREVIDACSDFLPGIANGSLTDPRVTVHVADAFGFVKESSDLYDLIVVDSTDTYEEEEGALSEMLFTAEFYSDLLSHLSENGVVVTQADNMVFCPYSLASISQLFQTVFPKVGSYQALVPSFGGYSAFVWGSRGTAIKTSFNAKPEFRYLNQATYELAFASLKF